MSFSKRLKEKRINAGLSQLELAEIAEISSRSIQNYESGKRYPSSMEITIKLAKALNTTSEYLLDSDGEYLMQAQEKGGTQARREVEGLISEITGLFAGGELDQNEKDAVMQALSEAYWIAKSENKKYSSKKY